MDGACSTLVEMRNNVAGKHEWKRPTGKYRFRWKNNIKMDIQKKVSLITGLNNEQGNEKDLEF
jgi:hypothetical protein